MFSVRVRSLSGPSKQSFFRSYVTRVRGFFEDLAGHLEILVKFLAHPDVLRALSGKREDVDFDLSSRAGAVGWQVNPTLPAQQDGPVGETGAEDIEKNNLAGLDLAVAHGFVDIAVGTVAAEVLP